MFQDVWRSLQGSMPTIPTGSAFLPVHHAWREAGELLELPPAQLWSGVQPQGVPAGICPGPCAHGSPFQVTAPSWLWLWGASVLTGLTCAGQEGHISRAASSSPAGWSCNKECFQMLTTYFLSSRCRTGEMRQKDMKNVWKLYWEAQQGCQ